MISWRQFALLAFRPAAQPASRDVTEAVARGVQNSPSQAQSDATMAL
jgi:hypothetical protein